MTSYDKQEVEKLYGEFQRCQTSMRTETNPSKNLQATNRALAIMQELESHCDRETLNELARRMRR
jgi:flagellin-specific chaperone FliS